MKKRKIVSAIAFLVVTAVSISNAALNNVSADTLSKWITIGTSFDFIFIDIRDTAELTSIIATSACHPYHLSWREGVFEADRGKLPKDAHIVLYCRTSNRSGSAGALLVDSGYTSVYHLTGGISGWTGPTRTSASIKPAAELPEPSMPARATRVTVELSAQGTGLSIGKNGDNLLVPERITAKHRLDVFDLKGRLVFVVKSPFSHSTSYTIPKKIAVGVHVAELSVHDRPKASIVVNPSLYVPR